MSERYACDACGETFVKGSTDEDARREAEAAFSPAELQEPAVVCDDCWRAMRAAMPDFDARYPR